MNPSLIAAAAIAWSASIGVSGWWFYGAGQDAEIASHAKIDKAIQQTRDAAQQGAANAISQIQVKNTTIRQALETRVREVPVYRSAECQHDLGVFDNLNSVLRGESAGQSVVPQGSGSAQ